LEAGALADGDAQRGDFAEGAVAPLAAALGFFLSHGNACDEVEEAVAVLLGWDWRNLIAFVTETFPEVLDSFDKTILFGLLEGEREN
jgi:hypothetical protein